MGGCDGGPSVAQTACPTSREAQVGEKPTATRADAYYVRPLPPA